MNNRKGFTLMEMMVVIILIGVIAAIAIPNVIKLINNQNKEKYNAHIKLVKQALDLYTLRNKGEFDSCPNAGTYRLEYSKLLGGDEPLLIEDGITCTGYIFLTPKKNNSYSYEYHLTCQDKNSTRYIDENKNNTCNNSCSSTGCVIIN